MAKTHIVLVHLDMHSIVMRCRLVFLSSFGGLQRCEHGESHAGLSGMSLHDESN